VADTVALSADLAVPVDVPVLASWSRRVVAALLEPSDPSGPSGPSGGWEVALPEVAGARQPLAAAYRTALADAAAVDVAVARLSVRRFAAARRVRLLTAPDLLADPAVAASDPQLRSFVNVNDEHELARARETHTG
jgi:molybdopterin-guanine dinucleotide biosynthesis protein A